MKQTVDIPVPGGDGVSLVFKVFPLNRVQQRRSLLRNAFLSGSWSRSLSRFWWGLQGFRPGQSSSASSSFPAGVLEDANEPGEGVFRTFPQNEKSAASAPSPSPRVHTSVSSSTPAPQLRLYDWVVAFTGEGPLLLGPPHGGETRWQMKKATCPFSRFSRRLTACDVVVGASL